MAPTKKTPPAMTQAAIRKLVKDSVKAAIATERAAIATKAATASKAARTAEAVRIAATTINTRGPNPSGPPVINIDPVYKSCTFNGYLNCQPTNYKGTNGAVNFNPWFEKAELVVLINKCTENEKVQYATGPLLDEALSWWNLVSQPMDIQNDYKLSGDNMKKEYYPHSEMPLKEPCCHPEVEFWNHAVKGTDILSYNRRFHELRILCPTMVSTNEKLLEEYIWGLPPSIQGNMITSSPKTLDEAMRMSRSLMDQVVQTAETQRQNFNNSNNNRTNNNKRPWDGNHGSNNNNNNNHHNQQNKRQGAATTYVAAPTKGGYSGTQPQCTKCNFHHSGPCPAKCRNCQNTGHLAQNCRAKTVATGSNAQPIVICFGCGESGHYRNRCPQQPRPTS